MESEKAGNGSLLVIKSAKDKAAPNRRREEVAKPSHVDLTVRTSQQKPRKGKSAQVSDRDQLSKRHNTEASAKEEGEISDTEEPRYREKLDQKAREERWREWCETNMQDNMHTLRKLEKLQRTSSDLPKDEVSSISKLGFFDYYNCVSFGGRDFALFPV